MIDFDDLNKPTENWFSITCICFATVMVAFAMFATPHFWWSGIVSGFSAELVGIGFIWCSGRVWNTNRVLRWWMILAGVANLIVPWTAFLSWLGDHTILK